MIILLENQLKPVLTEESLTKLKKSDIDKPIEFFCSDIFDKIYRFGEVQTKPMKQVAEKFQEIRFQDPSGLKSKHVEESLASVALCGTALALIPMSIPGYAITSLAKIFSNNFSYSPAKLKERGSEEEFGGDYLKIMTWNTGLGPGFMSIDNRLKKPEERIDSILKMIDRQDPNILSLQEVFDEGAAKLLVQKLNRRGYDCVHSILASGSVTLSSGLFVAVKRESAIRIEVEEVRVWKFRNLASADRLSNKGLVGLKLNMIRNGISEPLHLFNTHLQASYETEGFGEVRQQQVAAISKVIREWTKGAKDKGVILCGDLNFAHKPLEKSDSRKLAPLYSSGESPSLAKEEYDVQMEAFEKEAFLFDLNKNAQYSENGTFYYLKQGLPKKMPSIVDYILTNKYLREAQGLTKIINLKAGREILPSDHCPLVHDLNFKNRPRPIKAEEFFTY